VLLDLVIAQLLSGLESEENCTSLVLAQEDGRGSAAARGFDFTKIPALHRGEECIRPWINSTSP
jgi:hypothetical protein